MWMRVWRQSRDPHQYLMLLQQRKRPAFSRSFSFWRLFKLALIQAGAYSSWRLFAGGLEFRHADKVVTIVDVNHFAGHC